MELGRFLNQTLGGSSAAVDAQGGTSSATSALGAFLSRGNHHTAARAAAGGVVPSNTSRYFSIDYGLIHLVSVDMNGPSNFCRAFSQLDRSTFHSYGIDAHARVLLCVVSTGYYGVDPCGQPCIDAQKAWLAADLAAANENRDNVPWVVGVSHYPPVGFLQSTVSD